MCTAIALTITSPCYLQHPWHQSRPASQEQPANKPRLKSRLRDPGEVDVSALTDTRQLDASGVLPGDLSKLAHSDERVMNIKATIGAAKENEFKKRLTDHLRAGRINQQTLDLAGRIL